MDIPFLIINLLQKLVYVVLPFFVCLSAILLLEKIAPFIGYTDKPDGRKQHIGDIPIVGGVAIYTAFFISIVVLLPNAENFVILLFSLMMVILGMLDDYFDINPNIRFACQAAIIIAAIYFTESVITNLGAIVPGQNFEMSGLVAFTFTLFCAIGVINSINMIDGVDGLSGSLLVVSLLSLALIGWLREETVTASLAFVLGGTLLAFLCFNARVFVKRARIFLGDSGTLFLGFVLFYCFVTMTQNETVTLSPIAAGWIFGLPLIDTISVIIRRISKGLSPFKAGRDHLHHRLLFMGLTINKTVVMMLGLHLSLLLVGLLINHFRSIETVMFWAFVGIVVAYHYGLDFCLNRLFKLEQGVKANPLVDVTQEDEAPSSTGRL